MDGDPIVRSARRGPTDRDLPMAVGQRSLISLTPPPVEPVYFFLVMFRVIRVIRVISGSFFAEPRKPLITRITRNITKYEITERAERHR